MAALTTTTDRPVGTFSWARASALSLVGVPVLVRLATVDPNAPGHYPLCPFKWMTGLDCPGCGTLRAVHSLTHGDLLGALDHNALAVITMPLLAVCALLWVMRRPPPRLIYSRVFTLVFFTCVMTFWLLRNLPIDALRPLGSA